MRAITKMAAARHFVALWLLAVVMSIFASTGGRAKASAAEGQMFADPVTSTMTWERADTDNVEDPSFGESNCPGDCPDSCPIDGSCPFNCNPGCASL